jgi:hypothetical protein
MSTKWIEFITKEKLREIEKETNFDFKYEKQSFDISITIDTDRNDKNIAFEIKDFYTSINKISLILGCGIDDLDIIYNREKSDHEMVTHSLNVDNRIDVGYFVLFENEIYKIINFKSGVYRIKNVRTNEDKVSSIDYIDPVCWHDVLNYI